MESSNILDSSLSLSLLLSSSLLFVLYHTLVPRNSNHKWKFKVVIADETQNKMIMNV